MDIHRLKEYVSKHENRLSSFPSVSRLVVCEKEMEEEQFKLAEQNTDLNDKIFSLQSALANSIMMLYSNEGDKEIAKTIENQDEEEEEQDDFELIEADEFQTDEFNEFQRKSNDK